MLPLPLLPPLESKRCREANEELLPLAGGLLPAMLAIPGVAGAEIEVVVVLGRVGTCVLDAVLG